MTPMDGPDRPSHRRRPTAASDLLSCFATRRRRRRSHLRSCSSVKGGTQSPAIFPSIRRNKAPSSLDAPSAEPSSPKVSCIGQVRVKTARRRRKKNAKKKMMKNPDSRSKDPTFTPSSSNHRPCFPSRQQSWVHLPLGNLCHGLNCFRPCEKEKKAPPLPPSSSSPRCCSCSCSCGACCERRRRRGKRPRMCACRATFGRCWLMEAEEKEEEEEREVVVVMRERSRRGTRELELLADELEKGELKIPPAEEEGEAAPACVPPRNALLLMRCRSDPTRMNSLAATRFDDSSVSRNAGSVVEEEERREREEEAVEENEKKSAKIGSGKGKIEEKDRALLPPLPLSARKNAREEEEEEKENRDSMEEARKREGVVEKGGEKEERRRSFKRDGGGAVVARRSTSYREGSRSSFSTEGEARRSSFEKERRRRWSFSSEKDARRGEGKTWAAATKEVKEGEGEGEGEGEKRGKLPDCLLLMMCEPKLSMEVSKETWVCTADFVRRRPQQRRQQQDHNVDGVTDQVTEETINPVGEVTKNEPSELTIDPTPPEATIDPMLKPPQSTLPPLPRPQVPSSLQLEPRKPVSAGNNAVESAAYGPFALMRCKSEPARSSAVGHISLDGCFWRSRHQPVSAAGIGF